MKCASLVVAVLALVATPALAEEGRVSKSTLGALGLSGMQTVSDAEGMSVRGKLFVDMSVKGTSLITGQLLTPDTKNFVVASSVNEVDGDFTSVTDPTLIKNHIAFVGLTPAGGGAFAVTPVTLTVTALPTLTYTGTMFGFASGFGSIVQTP